MSTLLHEVLAVALHVRSDRSLALALATMDVAGDPGRGPGPSPSPAVAGPDDPESDRLRALVDLATAGDAEAFGQLYDRYATGVYRFIYYRVGTTQLAEDLTSETFVRALKAVQRFTWQGKDFGAWLTTIARNLVTDHYKSSRSRLEVVADQVPDRRSTVARPEEDVLELLTHETLYEAIDRLPAEQRDCVLMRFIQGLSIAETAAALGRSEGAVKQLQLRAVRALAKLVSKDTP